MRLERLYDAIESRCRRAGRSGAEGAYRQPQSHPRSGPGRRRARGRRCSKVVSSPRPSHRKWSRSSPGRRGSGSSRRRLSPRHLRALAQRVEVADSEVRIMGSKGDLLQNPCRRLGRKIGYARRSQFCSEVADRGDSNPRYGCPYAAFRVRCLQPLGHLSVGPVQILKPGSDSKPGRPAGPGGLSRPSHAGQT